MSRKRLQNDATPDARSNTFAALEALRGSLAPGPAVEPQASPASAPFAGRILITRERKGRAGKTVTRVCGIALAGDALEELAREIRQALGTGGGLEGESIVLHGDQSARISEWLTARGAAHIVKGS